MNPDSEIDKDCIKIMGHIDVNNSKNMYRRIKDKNEFSFEWFNMFFTDHFKSLNFNRVNNQKYYFNKILFYLEEWLIPYLLTL